MCGIVGIFNLDGKPVDRALLERMNDLQTHRGPDESGIYLNCRIGLAHKRLSIIDLSSGKQPLFNEDGTVCVVYNGEIYNFTDLRKELEEAGHRFKTKCDTEVIVHAWEEWSTSCVERFRGMFAFALWDDQEECLFLARDRLGIKPLYYAYLDNGDFVFSSELKSILAHPDVRRELDPYAVDEYFAYGYVPEPRTIFKDIYKLLPGHGLVIRPHLPISISPFQYWNVEFKPEQGISIEEWSNILLDKLGEAVRIRLISDVPLGAFLSGGVDSSSVVAMMAQHMNEPVKTCSISFKEKKYDESRYAQQVSDLYRTEHHVKTVEVNDFSLLDKLSSIYDEPFADSSSLPTYRVCELARQHVTVALSGDGGDENLAGYRRYKHHLYEEKIRSIVPYSLRRCIFGSLAAIYPKADWAPRIFRAKATFEALSKRDVESYFHTVSNMSDSIRREIYSDAYIQLLNDYHPISVLERHAERGPDHPLSLIQYLDIKTYLVGDILTKVDRASMANSLEVRVPFLDHLFVECMAKIPPDLKLKDGEGKYILKRCMENYLPDDILYRRKKGFAVPISQWFRNDLRERVEKLVHSEALLSLGIFNERSLSNLYEQHVRGVRDNSVALWSLLIFESFSRRYLSS